jgi:glycerate 2-kinase
MSAFADPAAGPRVLVSPDKFKGTLSASEAAAIIARAVLTALPGAQVTTLPVADGGEGTVDAVLAAGWTHRISRVAGPCGELTDAIWATDGNTAVIELAAASGLLKITPSDHTAAHSGTFGTGQLILEAIDSGAKRIVLGLGGSASTDGGTGALTALGARFLDSDGQQLPPGGAALADLADADLRGLDARLARVQVDLCCDVERPLLGAQGAAAVFGPQKGATPERVQALDGGLRRLAMILNRLTGRDAAQIPWGGAAGGTSGGLFAAVGANYANGLDTVAELIGLDGKLATSDLVIVGEGSLDEQSLTGKAPVGVARRAQRFGVITVAVAGRLQLEAASLKAAGIAAAVGAADLAGSAALSAADPVTWLTAAVAAVIREVLEREAGEPCATRPQSQKEFK